MIKCCLKKTKQVEQLSDEEFNPIAYDLKSEWLKIKEEGVNEGAIAVVLQHDFCYQVLLIENELELPIHEYLAKILPKLSLQQLSTFMDNASKFFN